jgi:methylglutaconyl-CoA hydratase
MNTVTVKHHGAITVLELSSPSTGNALGSVMAEELTHAVAEVRGSAARAVVITGAGKHFCTGASLAEIASTADLPLAERNADADRLGALYAAWLRLPQFTVAAVNGAAYGGGAGLAGACDLVVAGTDAKLQFSEVRLGFVPALIAVFLTRRVVPARLFQLFADPSPLTAEEASRWGLVDEVAADSVARAIEHAAAVVAKAAPSAVAATKKLLLDLTLPHLDEQLARAAHCNAAQREHPECRRGLAHFLAERSFPTWSDD